MKDEVKEHCGVESMTLQRTITAWDPTAKLTGDNGVKTTPKGNIIFLGAADFMTIVRTRSNPFQRSKVF